jgi:hypothetical protein
MKALRFVTLLKLQLIEYQAIIKKINFFFCDMLRNTS